MKSAGGAAGASKVDPESYKFMFCVPLEKSVYIIVGIEAVMCIVHLIIGNYVSPFLFNIPLLIFYFQSANNKKLGNLEAAYKWNTLFITFFAIRYVIMAISCFVLLVISSQETTVIDGICYEYFGAEEITKVQTEGAELEGDLAPVNTCRDNLITVGWLAFLPIMIFEAHCLITMRRVRNLIENVELKETAFEEEEDI